LNDSGVCSSNHTPEKDVNNGIPSTPPTSNVTYDVPPDHHLTSELPTAASTSEAIIESAESSDGFVIDSVESTALKEVRFAIYYV